MSSYRGNHSDSARIGSVTRRGFVRATVGALASGIALKTGSAGAAAQLGPAGELEPYPQELLPGGIRSRFVSGVNGLRMHVLEAGFESSGRPLVYDELAKLSPPRKHYQRYYQTREANANLWQPRQGLHAFLRAYYHMKSADWASNAPRRLAGRTATEWARLPRYYVMDLDQGMSETVAQEMPSPAQVAACRWLTEAELDVYTVEYGRTGFQGGLNGYRLGDVNRALQVFAGRKIDVPAIFAGGRKDWGVFQDPGALERLETTHTTKYEGTTFVDGAGHWVQQEQPASVSALLIQFFKRH